jgi:hypothetical protein
MKKLLVRAGAIGGAVSGALYAILGTAHAAIITLPSSTDVFAGVETYSGPTFTEFLLVVLAGVGITIAAMVLGYLVGTIKGAAGRLLARRKGQGRRGRR